MVPDDPPPSPSRTLLCLATAKGAAVACSLPADRASRLAVCTFKETGVTRSHDGDIREEAARRGIPVVALGDWRADPLGVLKEHRIDRIVCIGWRYLIPEAVADALGGEVIVAHDSLLPKLRGFAPLPTALLTGEDRTGVTFLRAAAEVDAGPVHWQRSVAIGPRDTIAALIEKVIPLYVDGVRAALGGGFGEPVPQDPAEATYSLWRDDDDYELDWALDAETLGRAVRALGDPYAGARTSLGGRPLVVREAAVLADLPFALRQPGKVWSLEAGGRPVVVCGRGLLRIDGLVDEEGASALPLTRLRQRFGSHG